MTPKNVLVVGVSLGTGLLLLLCTAILTFALVLTHINAGSASGSKNPSWIGPGRLPKTSAGDFESIEAYENWKYGPVNKDAQKEEKNGLFDRIRANRQSRMMRNNNVQSSCCVPVQAIPVQAYTVQTQGVAMDCTDCNYSYQVAQPVVLPAEYPMFEPSGPNGPPPSPIMTPTQTPGPCPDGSCRPAPMSLFDEPVSYDHKSELKTGSYVCSSCRRARVGNQWHTDWTPDGKPVTYLCTDCNERLNANQKNAVYDRYVARQTKTLGAIGTYHPEIE
jgi:hypothetical protein